MVGAQREPSLMAQRGEALGAFLLPWLNLGFRLTPNPPRLNPHPTLPVGAVQCRPLLCQISLPFADNNCIWNCKLDRLLFSTTR